MHLVMVLETGNRRLPAAVTAVKGMLIHLIC